jgi:DNA oxidative demethylase
MTPDLFQDEPRNVALAPGATLLGGFALAFEKPLLAALDEITAAAGFRHMLVPGGRRMSVAMTNCGQVGWISDVRGYRYDPIDPASGHPWPSMPTVFAELASGAASHAGFEAFAPDACLVNRYEPAARLSLHQDRDERDFEAPIVSVSLGLPAIFLFGGLHRSDPTARIAVRHGDVVVWGGPSRLRYHGVLPLEPGTHPLMGPVRINLTFRKAR